MSNKERAILYAEEAFNAASKVDVASSALAKIIDQIQGLLIDLPKASEDAVNFDIDNKPLEFSLINLRGPISLQFFTAEPTNIDDPRSFLCSVKAIDVAGRELKIDGLTESRNEKIGHYFYLKPNSIGVAEKSFVIPAHAEKVFVIVQRYKESDDKLLVKPFYQIIPADLMRAMKEYKATRVELLRALRSARDESKRIEDTAGKFPPFLYIMDEFSEKCIRSAHERIYPLSRSNFLSQISQSNSDILFLESTWNGNGGSWRGAMTFENPHHEQKLALKAAICIAKSKGMKVIFYNKEDPMHFEKFLPYAAEADFVFTSDLDCVQKYSTALPDKKVEVLTFAAPAKLCNPQGALSFDNRQSVAFAGGYYGENHEHRVHQMDYMLPVISEFEGTIFDRHSEHQLDRYRFPEQYQQFCTASIGYEQMVQEYRKFKVFINVNTIVDSPTMLSRRMYELLASGTPVVSAPSRALEEQFSGVVSLVDNTFDAIQETRRLLEDKTYWLKRSHVGYRHVMKSHTYNDRLRQVLTAVTGTNFQESDPLVSIVTPTKEANDYVRIIENVFSQSYDRLELVVGFGSRYSKADIEAFIRKFEIQNRKTSKNIKLRYIHFSEVVSLGFKLNRLIQEASGEIIAKFDDDDFYGPHYLSDMLLPMKWGGFDVIGKRATYWHDVATNRIILKHPRDLHKQSDFIYGATLVGRRNMFVRHPFLERNTGEDTFQLAQLKSSGYRIYASDPYNFCIRRRASNHTWELPSGFWDRDCENLPPDFVLANIFF